MNVFEREGFFTSQSSAMGLRGAASPSKQAKARQGPESRPSRGQSPRSPRSRPTNRPDRHEGPTARQETLRERIRRAVSPAAAASPASRTRPRAKSAGRSKPQRGARPTSRAQVSPVRSARSRVGHEPRSPGTTPRRRGRPGESMTEPVPGDDGTLHAFQSLQAAEAAGRAAVAAAEAEAKAARSEAKKLASQVHRQQLALMAVTDTVRPAMPEWGRRRILVGLRTTSAVAPLLAAKRNRGRARGRRFSDGFRHAVLRRELWRRGYRHDRGDQGRGSAGR